MKRILLACFLLAACHKEGSEGPARRAVSDAPPPPAIQLPSSAQEGFQVVAARPRGTLVGMVRPTLTFSEPVVALATLEQQDPAAQIRLEPAVKGRWRWLGSASVEFVNDEPFPYSTSFRVTVPQGLKSLGGSKLAQAFTLEFTTPTVEVLGRRRRGWFR